MKCLMKSVGQLLRGLSLVLLLVGLSACAGGGGGSSSSSSAPAPSVALTDANAEQVTAAAFEQFLGDTTLDAAPVPLTAATTTRTRTTSTLIELAKKAANILTQSSSKFSAAATDQCFISGSTTTSYGADGTSATITYNDCEDDPGVIINGSMSVSNISASGSVVSFTTSFNLTFSVSGQPDVVLSGGYTFAFDTTTLATTVTGTFYSGTDGTETFELFNFTFFATLSSTSADYTLSSTMINGVVTVKTLTPFAYSTGVYPDAGQMQIAGANNSRILVTVFGDETAPVNNQVQIEVDADGDAVFETTIMTTWAALGI